MPPPYHNYHSAKTNRQSAGQRIYKVIIKKIKKQNSQINYIAKTNQTISDKRTPSNRTIRRPNFEILFFFFRGPSSLGRNSNIYHIYSKLRSVYLANISHKSSEN